MTAPHQVDLASALCDKGYSYAELARLVDSGALVRVRRGAYVRRLSEDPLDRHRQLVAATLPQLSGQACLSHASAALLHGLPGWAEELDRVHVIRAQGGGGRRGSLVHVHPAPLPAEDLVELDGLRVTSLARTVVDCARTWPYERAVCLGDAALRAGLSRDELLRVLQRRPSRHGDPAARRVAAFADAGAESVGESASRVVLHRLGVSAPQTQFEVTDRHGQFVARADFGWPGHQTLGEFDGKVKYGRLLRPEETAGDVIYREKLREDRLRDLGWQVVRWTWDDLRHATTVVDRLQRAFRRGASRTLAT